MTVVAKGYSLDLRSIGERVRRRLRARLGRRLVGLLLYGSAARGELGAHSDIDFYVVAKGLPPHPWDRSRYLRGLVAGLGVHRRLALRGARPEELSEVRPLYLDLAVDGIVVEDRGGVLAHFLRCVRKQIREAGLVRYRTRDGAYGWKRQPPLMPGERLVLTLGE